MFNSPQVDVAHDFHLEVESLHIIHLLDYISKLDVDTGRGRNPFDLLPPPDGDGRHVEADQEGDDFQHVLHLLIPPFEPSDGPVFTIFLSPSATGGRLNRVVNSIVADRGRGGVGCVDRCW